MNLLGRLFPSTYAGLLARSGKGSEAAHVMIQGAMELAGREGMYFGRRSGSGAPIARMFEDGSDHFPSSENIMTP